MAWFGGVLQVALGGLGIPLGLLSLAFTFEFAILGHLAGGLLDATGLQLGLIDDALPLLQDLPGFLYIRRD